MIRTTVGVEGMMCGMCESHVSAAVRRSVATKSVKCNRRKRTCVIVSEDEIDHALLTKAIAETGYEVTSVRSEPYKKRGLFG